MTAPADCIVCCPAGWSPNIDQVPDEDCLEHGRTSSPTGVATPGTIRRVPNQPKTPLKSFRIPDELYRAAQAKAADRDETVSDVVRRALERYVRSKS